MEFFLLVCAILGGISFIVLPPTVILSIVSILLGKTTWWRSLDSRNISFYRPLCLIAILAFSILFGIYMEKLYGATYGDLASLALFGHWNGCKHEDFFTCWFRVLLILQIIIPGVIAVLLGLLQTGRSQIIQDGKLDPNWKKFLYLSITGWWMALAVAATFVFHVLPPGNGVML